MIKYLLVSSNNVCMFHLPNRYVLCNNFPVPKYTYIHRSLLMASTRFRDDFARQEDQIRQSTQPLDYILNAPGNGLSPDYMEDPHIRLQKWGGNLATNSVTLERLAHGVSATTEPRLFRQGRIHAACGRTRANNCPVPLKQLTLYRTATCHQPCLGTT